MLACFVVFLVQACGGRGDGPSASAPESPPTPEAPSPGEASAATPPPSGAAGALPDVAAGLAKGLCESGPGKEGADAYFVGEYAKSGASWTSTERWFIFSNSHLKAAPKWKADGGTDECIVQWRATATETTRGACGDCDLSIKVEGTVDTSATTCPEGIFKKERDLAVSYDLKRLSDGTVLWYFSGSGKRMGQGYHNAERMNFVTDHKCQWF